MQQSDGDPQGWLCINGQYVAAADAVISPLDRGLLYGDGVFETIRAYSGVPFRLEAHLRRLGQALRFLKFPAPPDAPSLGEAVTGALKRSGLLDATVRITVTRGQSIGFSASTCKSCTTIVAALPLRAYPSETYRVGIKTRLLWPRYSEAWPPPTIKTTSYQGAVLARQELEGLGYGDGLYTDQQGNITESTTANIFVVHQGKLQTPPANVCLPGITRAEIIALAAASGMEISEMPLRPDTLRTADEAFLTSSLAEVLPITWFDDAAVGSGAPGPIFKNLHGLYRESVATTTRQNRG